MVLADGAGKMIRITPTASVHCHFIGSRYGKSLPLPGGTLIAVVGIVPYIVLRPVPRPAYADAHAHGAAGLRRCPDGTALSRWCWPASP
jgi:hypothetical protein